MNIFTHYFTFLNSAIIITAPIFLMMALGAWLRYIKLINQEFIQIASNLVFKIGLPVMLFTSTSSHDFSQLVNYRHLLLILSTTIIIFIASSIFANKIVEDRQDKGVIVQGAFRGNLVIIGLAFCANAYPEQGIAIATLPMALIIVVYNVLSIYTLNTSLQRHQSTIKKNVVDSIKNPLIIGICLGLLSNFINIQLPTIIVNANNYLAQMTLPLALISIGGSLGAAQLSDNIRPAVIASIWKVLVCPAVFIMLCFIYPIDPIATGVLFFLTASPTATASFVMVKAMGGNSDLASKIIIISTLFSVITITLGFALLQSTSVVN
ncbi:MAG: AEC family transporter [Colwellia sp.]|nr:AEC family transporter [Colwellia sp.]